jgi:hypothetical protein
MDVRPLALLPALSVTNVAFAQAPPPAPPPAAAPETAPEETRHWKRAINGHLFIPSLVVADPFLATTFSLTTGAGYAWFDGPGFDMRGDVNMARQDSYVAEQLSVKASFQANLLRWWAFRAGGGGGVAAGADGKSALVLGAQVPLDVALGTTVSWQLGRFIRLGGMFDFDYQYSKVVTPLAAVRSSFLAGQADTTNAVIQGSSYFVEPGAAVAFAPFRALGLVATFQYLWVGTDIATLNPTANNLVFGVSAQVDLRPIWHRVPIGVIASYRASVPVANSGPESDTHDLEGGVYYTGRDSLVLGLVAQGRWLPVRQFFFGSEILATFVIRYYWN